MLPVLSKNYQSPKCTPCTTVTLLQIVNDSLIENVQLICPTKLDCVQSYYTEMGQTMVPMTGDH